MSVLEAWRTNRPPGEGGGEPSGDPLSTWATTSTALLIPQSIAPTQLLQPSNQRKGAIVFNRSDAKLALEFGERSPAFNRSVAVLDPGGYYEMPQFWLGQLAGIWAAAGSGFAEIREFS